MTKKKQGRAAPPLEGISMRGKETTTIGLGTILLGFIVLAFADPHGRNLAAQTSPFLILGGYAMVALGIFLPEKLPTSGPSSDTSDTSQSLSER